MAAGEPAIESPVVGIDFIMIWRRPWDLQLWPR
jgi:hypothetical protein